MIRPAVWPSYSSRRASGCEFWVGIDRARGMVLNRARRETDDVRCIMRFLSLRMSVRSLKSIVWKCLNYDERY